MEIGRRKGPVAGPLINRLAGAPYGFTSDQISAVAFVSAGAASRARPSNTDENDSAMTPNSRPLTCSGHFAAHGRRGRKLG